MFPIRSLCFQSIFDVSDIQILLQNDFLCFQIQILFPIYFQYSNSAGLETKKYSRNIKISLETKGNISKHSFYIGNVIHRLETNVSQHDFPI